MRALIVLVACVGCYKPSFTDCDISCANGDCPAGLACNAEHKCVADKATTCGGSGMPDALGPDASYCGDYAFPISNVTCPQAKGTLDWTLQTSQSIVSTANPIVPAGGPSAEMVGNAVLVRVHDLTVAPAAILTIEPDNQGNGLPLIILASGTVKIDGAIVVLPMKWADDVTLFAACQGFGSDGPACGSVGGSGGGGGGFGPVALPGAGGACFGGSGGDAGLPNGNATLVPLRGGCGGGNGLHAPGMQGIGGAGGHGGGALQISATILEVSGKINVGGGGATPGAQSGDGGGGGGAGGGLLLETAQGHLGPLSTLCANGGGGSSDIEPGQRGTCNETAAAGGGGVGGMGGAGAFGTTPGVTGGLGTMTSSAGGGGGGVGRIHMNGPFVRDTGAIVTPPDA